MNRTVSGLCFAAAVGLAATLGAQSPTTTASRATGDREVTINGCLSKAADGYMLTNARVEPNASSSTTTAAGATTTTASPPAGTSGSTTTAGATGTSGAASAPAMTWMLSGDSDLEKHVGHRIQVTGKTSWNGSMEHGAGATAAPPTSTTSTASTTTTASGSAAHPQMDVKSIKMVSTSCQ